MLISKVSDETGEGPERVGVSEEQADTRDHAPEYRAASELFDLMTKDTHFDDNDDDSLTTRDLVLLYKNIDIGTRLMNDANGMKLKKPNQYVETVIYNDEQDSESDLSEMYSCEDVHSVYAINQERLDFLNDKSFENNLCHKLGGLQIQSSTLSMSYDKHFLFKDPIIKDQLKNLNTMASCSEFDNLFSTSLLDYICCKRLEDNYNFYMDNIIKYVQHTIEQLKRISNGDYLTDRAKEKWREVNSKNDQENNTKVLATSTSIPLHVECKRSGRATWDDIVHSEVDVRSLSKILEKKIVVEIPKLICGSYRLYSKRCADNLIISCQREQQRAEEGKEPRVDVVLQLQRSQSGQVMSNISSIMILQTTPALPDIRAKEMLPLPYKEVKEEEYAHASNEDDSKEPKITVIELCRDTGETVLKHESKFSTMTKDVKEQEKEGTQGQEKEGSVTEDYETQNDDYPYSECEHNVSCDMASNRYSSGSSDVALGDVFDMSIFPVRNEASFNLISPRELRMTMQRLHMQTALSEESEDVLSNNNSKNKSPVRVRIKSPYENRSHIMEEKKRKRLLEIRERREKNKKTLSENCKISKHKYGKGSPVPQASNSVTKLSITNKSFYNSIYGQSLNAEDKQPKMNARKGQKNYTIPDVPIEQIDEEFTETPNLTPEKNGKKYINRSYYLDEAETEMMYMQLKSEEDEVENTFSASTSGASNEFNANLTLLSQLIGRSDTDLNTEEPFDADENPIRLSETLFTNEATSKDLPLNENSINTLPENSPNKTTIECDNNDVKKVLSTIECRKSIDKLYDLMRKCGKHSSTDIKTSTSKLGTDIDKNEATGASGTLGSDSGTSLKYHLTSSTPSCFSFKKSNPGNPKTKLPTVVPKVIISSKLQSPKVEIEKIKKDRRKQISSPLHAVRDNPLKAISQLLHEFDNVQKTRQKPAPEVKPTKKTEITSTNTNNDNRNIGGSHQSSFRRRSRLEQHLKDNDPEKKVVSPKNKRARPLNPMEIARIPHQQIFVEDKLSEKIAKKKVADIIDEAKEARGEAVRGPSKFNSRLNTLAQPKKSYVQARSEEYQNKHGRNYTADRLQRLATAPSPATERNLTSASLRSRAKRTEATPAASMRQPLSSVPPLVPRLRRSASSSPGARSPKRAPLAYKRTTSEASDTVSPTSPAVAYKHSVFELADTVKKMVAVESYVKDHYGSASPSEPLVASKARVPLVPIELDSSMASSPTTEEANELGNKLHRMIDSVLTKAAPLGDLTECGESTYKLTDTDTGNLDDERTDSDYHIDFLEDKNLQTAVGNISDENKDKTTDVENFGDNDKRSLQRFSSSTELEKLESALYSQMSGAFQKRLRIKNLTLTPKQSMQQVLVLQSGDSGPVLVKSTLSSVKMNKCSNESLHDLKKLSNSHFEWNFSQIPIQIATVGYAFPEYQVPRTASKASSPKVKFYNVPSITSFENDSSVKKNCTSDKMNQCFEDIHLLLTDDDAQVAVENSAVLSNVASLSHVTVTKAPKKTEPVEISKDIETASGEITIPITKVIETPISEKTAPKTTATAYTDDSKSDMKEANNIDQEKENVASEPSSNADNVDYTTSLDMLVGLLNEIQKITCQNQMSTANDENQCADLTSMLNDAAALENTDKDMTRDLVSISSLDKLRQLESTPSIYSLYISNNEGDSVETNSVEPVVIKSNFAQTVIDDTLKSDLYKPTCDKEVSVNLCKKEYVNSFTDAPSSMLPIAVNHSTNATNSLLAVIGEKSPQAIVSFTDYQTIYSNTLFRSQSIQRIIELPEINDNEQNALIARDKSHLNEECFATALTSIHNIEEMTKEHSVNSCNELSKFYSKDISLDPMLRVKRDILVTVYSILVLTVFAALSFPEMIVFEE